MIYFQLFFEFFKTGLFAIGGGLATLPFLNDMADRMPNWFTRADLANMIAVSESTPGPIGINMATYVGFKVSGILGALVSSISIVLPSLIVIILVAKFMQKFSENKLVKAGFYGIRPAVTGLIAAAGAQVFKIAVLTLESFQSTFNVLDLFNLKALGLFVVLFVLSRLRPKWHPIIWIGAGALAGYIFKF